MDFWNKARTFAGEAAKRSQELTMEAAKRSQELTSNLRFPEIVSETAKRSKELATEASNQIKAEALKSADLIKSFSLLDPASGSEKKEEEVVGTEELERFGIIEELREFVKGLTIDTFKEFPIPDDAPVSDVPTVSNVRQDLTEWQARHATLMLSTVKEISKLRYELCPRVMKERKFWRIYFILVNNHLAPYEKKYTEEAKLKSEEQAKNEKARESIKEVTVSKPEGAKATQPLKKATSSAEQDLDVFLLGDLGDSDDAPDEADGDDGDDGFDDDFDKIGESSEDEHAKDSKK